MRFVSELFLKVRPRPGRKVFLVAGLLLIVFNIWHSAMRGIWDGSILDSLTIGPDTLDLARQSNPDIRAWKSYDGQFFFAMTFDPLLITQESVPYIDNPPYRYRRVFYPLLGYLGAGGNENFFPYSLFFANLLGWFLIGFSLWKIGQLEGLPAGLLVVGGMFTTGITFATFRTLSETWMVALLLLGCYFWRKQSWIKSSIFFALAGLTKELTILVPLTIFAYALIRREHSLKTLFLSGLISFLPLVLWLIYVSFKLPQTGYTDVGRLSFPFLEMLKEARLGLESVTSLTEHVRTITVVVVTMLIVLFLFLYIWKFPTFWGVVVFKQAFFCAIVKGDIWNHHAGSVRVVCPLFVLSIVWFLQLAYQSDEQLEKDKVL